MSIKKLGHVGIYAQDFEAMRDFYTQVVGLQIAESEKLIWDDELVGKLS